MKKYGASGTIPPAMYDRAMVRALFLARFGSGSSSPNSNRIMKSTHRFLSARMESTTAATLSSSSP